MSGIPKYTVEQMDGFPEGFTYVDGDDHVAVGTVMVKEADYLAELEAARSLVPVGCITAGDAERIKQLGEKRTATALALLAEACRVIDSLADQQAMPDDYYTEPLGRFRAALESAPHAQAAPQDAACAACGGVGSGCRCEKEALSVPAAPSLVDVNEFTVGAEITVELPAGDRHGRVVGVWQWAVELDGAAGPVPLFAHQMTPKGAP